MYVHKKEGNGVSFTLGRCVPTVLPEMLGVCWVAAVLAVLQLAVKDKAWPEILRSHKSNFPTLKLEVAGL